MFLIMKFAILDRDGIINNDFGHVGQIDRFVYNEGIFEFLDYLISKDFKIVIFTNQAGIAKNYYRLSDFFKLSAKMLSDLEKRGIQIFHIFWCPHHIDGDVDEFKIDCHCRKPKSGMLDQLAAITDIDFENSFVIGDKLTDIEAGKAFGLKNCFLLGDNPKYTGEKIAFKNFSDVIFHLENTLQLVKGLHGS